MYVRPAEWTSPKEIWLAWPYDASLWCHYLPDAQAEFLALVKALSKEKITTVVPNEQQYAVLKPLLNSQVECKIIPFGDIWFRDTLPMCVKDEHGASSLVLAHFNGWGEKYLFDDDRDLNQRVALHRQQKSRSSKLIFEGGAIECDGVGTMLTTEQCLLNPNRNPGLSKAEIEAEFSRLFGIKKVIWLKEGLMNDHTDGHIDTIARFIAPATVAIMVPAANDPNAQVMLEIKKCLELDSDALGRPLKLLEIPSPGAILNDDGQLMPASYLNFIIGDTTLVVPTYGSPYDNEAVKIFKDFSDLDVIGVSARSILSGGGAFHCMSQEFYL